MVLKQRLLESLIAFLLRCCNLTAAPRRDAVPTLLLAQGDAGALADSGATTRPDKW